MKYLLMALLVIATVRCSKYADATTTPVTEEKCKCSAKLVASKTEWFNGELCPAKDKAGANYKAQGSGRNNQGYTVVGCFTESIESTCECKP